MLLFFFRKYIPLFCYPGIPCQPIGYGDALQLLSKLGGAEAPLKWRGGFNNISHRLGPGFNKMYEVDMLK